MTAIRKPLAIGLGAVVALVVTAPAFAAGLSVTNTVLVQQRSQAADGTTRVSLTPASRVVPGDRIVYQMTYRNGEAKPIENLVLNNPLPSGIAYRGPAQGSPAPELSVDGKTFGPLASLTVRENGAARPARASDVRAVRWSLASAVPAGATGKLSFEAIVQ